MIRSIIIVFCTGLSGHDIIGLSYAAAAVPPSGSPPPSASPWRSGEEGYRYRRGEDIPVMGDRLPRPSWGGARRRRRRRDGVAGAEDAFDSSDVEGDSAASRSFGFFSGRDDNDRWRDQEEYHRRRGRFGRNRRGDDRPLNSIHRWVLEKSGVRIPRVNFYFDPVTMLKIRKSWHNVVPGAIVRVGADLETHRLGRGLWRLRGCVEDKLIGGRFTIKEMCGDDDVRTVLVEYSKSWLFAGAGSAGSRFNFCARYDLAAQRGVVRLGFRAEHADTIGSYELLPGRKGFSIAPTMPLDADRRVLLEVKTNVELPEPEFIIGSDFDGASANRESLGIDIGGDIDVEMEEVNLIFSL